MEKDKLEKKCDELKEENEALHNALRYIWRLARVVFKTLPKRRCLPWILSFSVLTLYFQEEFSRSYLLNTL